MFFSRFVDICFYLEAVDREASNYKTQQKTKKAKKFKRKRKTQKPNLVTITIYSPRKLADVLQQKIKRK